MKKIKKINARVAPDIERKLREIVSMSGSSMSEVIAQSIELYFRQGFQASRERPFEIAQRTGIIGSLKGGPASLSQNYKDYLAEGLSKKYQRSE